MAVDALQLALKDADEIILRADAEAFKIEDITDANKGVSFLAYCQINAVEEMQDVYSRAFRIMSSAGAEIATTPDAVLRRVRERVG